MKNMSPQSFVKKLTSLKFENAFNPYSDVCPIYDLPDAPRRRIVLIATLLERAKLVEVDAIWIGRDLGYRGGRRTGFALTDDINFENHLNRWGIEAQRPTIGKVMSERTATVIWNVLDKIDANIFLWNVFPLHPHEVGNPFTNRKHSSNEQRAGVELLKQLIIILNPKRIIAIGNDAATVLGKMRTAIPLIKVRHPSYGGQKQFLEQMQALYGFDSNQQELLF